MKNVIRIACLLVFFASCKKDNVIGPQCIECPSDSLILDIKTKLFIINEGNFGWGNASLSLYDTETQLVQNQIYQTANNNNLLGDVAMSLEVINSLGYITINNSNKITVIDITTFEKKAEITGVNSPRFIKQVTNNKAYVTSLYANKIYSIDLLTNTILTTIETRGWTEELLVYDQKAFVINKDLNQLQIIDVLTDKIIDSVQVGISPNSLVLDVNNTIWILCDGGFEVDNATLHSISTTNYSILSTIPFATLQDSPEDLAINREGKTLYFLHQGVVKMNITANSIPITKVVQKNNRTLYGLEIDANTEDIYIADAKDYVQEGLIYRYNSTGNKLDSFQVGIIPGTFTFYSK